MLHARHLTRFGEPTALSGDVGGPVRHKLASTVEQVGALVSRLDAVGVDVRQREGRHAAGVPAVRSRALASVTTG